MSKIILTADLHAGVRSDLDVFLKTFEHFFTKFLPSIIEKHGCQNGHLFILGDVFDNRNNINVKTKNYVLDSFNKITQKYPKLKIYILLGNHDIYYRNTRKITSLKMLENISNIQLIDEVTRLDIGGRSFVLCPWITQIEEQKDIFFKRADVCLGHFEINGFQMVEGYVESNGLHQSKFNNNFKLTFSGHFHLRAENKNITYVGNPWQTKWSDYGNDKGVYILDLDKMKKTFEPYNAIRFEKVFLSKLKKKQQNLKEVVPNNFVSLVVDDNISSKHLDKLNFLISSLKPYYFTISESPKNYDGVEISEESTSPIEYLIDFVKEMKLSNNIDKDKLTKKINELYELMV